MTDKALVSVVIPCYRCMHTLALAIASVAGQTLLPSEVILVDDASGDATRDILCKLSQQYEPGWIQLVFLVNNVGAASARNAGWVVAGQPYIAFLDADDAWHPRKIEIQYGFMVTHPSVTLSGHGFRMLRNGALPDWGVDNDNFQAIDKLSLLLSNPFVTPSVMVKRDIDFRFCEGQRYMEDHMLWMRVVCSGACVVKLADDLAAIYKNSFGAAGLSSRFWLMERGDLGNYRRLYRGRCINGLQLVSLEVYSLLKFLRRLVIYFGYLRWKR